MTIEEALETIGMATVYNFQPWTIKTAKRLDGSLLQPYLTLSKLVKRQDARIVPQYPAGEEFSRKTRFYTPYKSHHKKIAHNEVKHTSALADVLMAFIYQFPEYHKEIIHTPIFRHKGHRYKPDALVKLTHPNGLVWTFIVELERSRSTKAIYHSKLKPNNSMNLKEFGLDHRTKFLYIVAHERFNVFWRPMEYDQHPNEIAWQNNHLDALLKDYAHTLPDHKFRFITYHQFINIDQPIWVTPTGSKVSLI